MNFPKYPKLIKQVKYKDYEGGGLYLTRFANKDIPALFLGNEATHEQYAICNINPEDYALSPFEFAIKDYSENRGMLDWLITNSFMEEPHSRFVSGYVSIPVCFATEWLKQKITEICEANEHDEF